MTHYTIIAERTGANVNVTVTPNYTKDTMLPLNTIVVTPTTISMECPQHGESNLLGFILHDGTEVGMIHDGTKYTVDDTTMYKALEGFTYDVTEAILIFEKMQEGTKDAEAPVEEATTEGA